MQRDGQIKRNDSSDISDTAKITILLIDDNQQRVLALQNALDKSRYDIVHSSAPRLGIVKLVDELQPDLVIIDVESPSRDILSSLSTVSRFNPKPVVMFSENQDTKTIDSSVRAGVTAYVAGHTDANKIRPILDAAVASFTQTQALREELNSTKQALEKQDVITKAKLQLMQQRKMTEPEAYALLRKMAMDSSQSIENLAKSLVVFWAQQSQAGSSDD